MTSHPTPPGFPDSPRDFLANWTASRGNLRNFLENTYLPPIDDEAQREAGEAAAAAAINEVYDLDLDSYAKGVDSVSGSFDAAGAKHITAADPDIPIDSGTAAFFDVDNTLIQGSSLISFGLGLARKRFLNFKQIRTIAWKQLKFRISGKENAQDVDKGRELALDFFKGRSV